MEITREVELDAPVEEVWTRFADPDLLADWVGDEVRDAPVTVDGDAHRLTWTWAPTGVESTVTIELEGLPGDADAEERGAATRVRVVEVVPGATSPAASARACAMASARWDATMLDLELRALRWTHRLVGV